MVIQNKQERNESDWRRREICAGEIRSDTHLGDQAREVAVGHQIGAGAQASSFAKLRRRRCLEDGAEEEEEEEATTPTPGTKRRRGRRGTAMPRTAQWRRADVAASRTAAGDGGRRHVDGAATGDRAAAGAGERHRRAALAGVGERQLGCG